jgi:hypothetical protein
MQGLSVEFKFLYRGINLQKKPELAYLGSPSRASMFATRWRLELASLNHPFGYALQRIVEILVQRVMNCSV